MEKLQDVMQNSYKYSTYQVGNLLFSQVYGSKFHYQDLYELVGKDQFTTTFYLAHGSESHDTFGEYLIGVIFYSPKCLSALEKSLRDGGAIIGKFIRIIDFSYELKEGQTNELKYTGIPISHLSGISYLPYHKEEKRHETGEKEIPNIIYIETDASGIDVDRLTQNYLVKKNNDGVKLIQFEKEQLIGITLALNDRSIDKRILSHFGFSEKELPRNREVWKHYYNNRKRKGLLSPSEERAHKENSELDALSRLTLFGNELIVSKYGNSEAETDKSLLAELMQLVMDFSPSILLHGKHQVYWDLQSYLHIALRHVSKYQTGNFKDKTSLPYRHEDLKMLIEKVLHQIKDEISTFLREASDDAVFYRVGKMAVYFNGDHYHVRIDRNGRLVQFHSIEVQE